MMLTKCLAMLKSKALFLVAVFLLLDAIGSIAAQWQDDFFPYHVGRIGRIMIGAYFMVSYYRRKDEAAI
jgi:hypothetical protein